MISVKENRSSAADLPIRADDPVLSMLGMGKQLWDHEAGDSFVERLRSEDLPATSSAVETNNSSENLAETVWLRIQKHQREPFHTVSGLPFTYEVEGNGIWFFRDERRINRKLTRAQTEIAISRCPLQTTTEIKELMDYSYLFALLRDGRIRGQDW